VAADLSSAATNQEEAMPTPTSAAPEPFTADDDLAFAGVARLGELLAAGQVTPRELAEFYLARIERLDHLLGAFISIRAERALAEADAAQARLRAGERHPLLGIPIAVKDNVDLAGEVTTHASRAFGEPAVADSEVVRRLRAAGAVVLGKTALSSLAAWGHFTASEAFGVTRNPWDPARSPGGSSGGSAAAVAAGLVPITGMAARFSVASGAAWATLPRSTTRSATGTGRWPPRRRATPGGCASPSRPRR
jgi:amidase